MDFENLDISSELRERAKACKTPEELLELANSNNYKLSDAEVDAIAGGSGFWTNCSDQQCSYGF